MFDLCIIGAGVVGGLLASKLSEYDIRTVILEKENDVAMGASKANSAIVHAGFDAKSGTLKAKLNVRGSALMEETCRRLGVKYKRNGSLVLCMREEDFKTAEILLERGCANGVAGLRMLDGTELHNMEPELCNEALGALYAPTGAIICPYGLAIAAVGNAMDNGTSLIKSFKVVKTEKKEDEEGVFYRIYSEKENFVDARYVINSAGVFSDEISAMTGRKEHTVRPRRGEYMVLDKTQGGKCNCTVFTMPTEMGKGILITPTVDGNLLLGPTADDIDDKDDTETSEEGLSKVAAAAKTEIPSLDLGAVITSYSGLRATGDTGDFIIDFKDEHFIDLIGIESPGLSASPAIAEYVEEMLKEKGLLKKKKEDHISERKPYHWFSELTDEEKNKIIQKDPAFGRIVCRCEVVTEGEISYALKADPRPEDTDALKRRVRCGMGRCQGGFCISKVASYLAKREGTELTDVTKSGGDSRILTGKTKEEI